MNIETITEFMGWCTVINLVLMTSHAIMLAALRRPLNKLYRLLYGLDAESSQRACFQYLANYKIAVIVFNFIPYIALKIMAAS